jgi:hypothetical protein
MTARVMLGLWQFLESRSIGHMLARRKSMEEIVPKLTPGKLGQVMKLVGPCRGGVTRLVSRVIRPEFEELIIRL